MKSNRVPIFIIGGIVLLAIIGVVVYAASQNTSQRMSGMDHKSPTNDSQKTDSNAVEADTVTIEGFAYSPVAIKVKVGTKVTWTNKDGVDHTVTTQDGAPATIDSGLFGKDESFSYTFEKAGTYEYFCEPHPYMKGTVIVTE